MQSPCLFVGLPTPGLENLELTGREKPGLRLQLWTQSQTLTLVLIE